MERDMRGLISSATLALILLMASAAHAEFRHIELKTLGMD
jgi:hypothetical protein